MNGFELSANLGKLKSPTDMAFLPDGTLLTTAKSGYVHWSSMVENHRNGEVESEIILDLSSRLCDNGERGLSSVEPHPQYGVDNPFIYLFYTTPSNDNNCDEDAIYGPVNRLSRFVLDPVTYKCDIDSEIIFLETAPLARDYHNAGDIAFGKDGLMYVTLGDMGNPWASQDTSKLHGSIIRLTANNEIPVGNPYIFESGWVNSTRCNNNNSVFPFLEDNNTQKNNLTNKVVCQEIFAKGLRNPFKFAMNPNIERTQFYINDVGAAHWEEISIGGDGYENANYGWPVREGHCKNGRSCGNTCLISSSSRDNENEFLEPFYAYNHYGKDAAITAGVFVPNGIWPKAYDNKYLYADFVYGTIFRLDETDNACNTCCPVKSNFTGTPIMYYEKSDISAMKFGPYMDTQALYFLSRGLGGGLHRIIHVGDANRYPQASFTTNVSSGPVGTTIKFNATMTSDPDNDVLSYEWDFDGDGLIDSYELSPSHIFDRAGIYTVTMKVRDGKGGRSTALAEIGIGSPPIAEILIPREGHEFHVGEKFILTGKTNEMTVTDGSNMMWEVRQHHSSHYHSFLEPTYGDQIRLQAAPSPEDFLASTNSYLEVILTVTNSVGLKTSRSRKIMPKIITVKVDSEPQGLTILIDQHEIITPRTFDSWANHPLQLDAINQGNFAFESWLHEGKQKHFILMPMKVGIRPKFFAKYRDIAPTLSPLPSLLPPALEPIRLPSQERITSLPTRSFTVFPSPIHTLKPPLDLTHQPTTLEPTISVRFTVRPAMPLGFDGSYGSSPSLSMPSPPNSSSTTLVYISIFVSIFAAILTGSVCYVRMIRKKRSTWLKQQEQLQELALNPTDIESRLSHEVFFEKGDCFSQQISPLETNSMFFMSPNEKMNVEYKTSDNSKENLERRKDEKAGKESLGVSLDKLIVASGTTQDESCSSGSENKSKEKDKNFLLKLEVREMAAPVVMQSIIQSSVFHDNNVVKNDFAKERELILEPLELSLEESDNEEAILEALEISMEEESEENIQMRERLVSPIVENHLKITLSLDEEIGSRREESRSNTTSFNTPMKNLDQQKIKKEKEDTTSKISNLLKGDEGICSTTDDFEETIGQLILDDETKEESSSSGYENIIDEILKMGELSEIGEISSRGYENNVTASTNSDNEEIGKENSFSFSSNYQDLEESLQEEISVVVPNSLFPSPDAANM